VLSTRGEVEARGASLYLPTARWCDPRLKIEAVSLGKGPPFIHVAQANRIAAAGRGITVKG
jgi:hypothetical protein